MAVADELVGQRPGHPGEDEVPGRVLDDGPVPALLNPLQILLIPAGPPRPVRVITQLAEYLGEGFAGAGGVGLPVGGAVVFEESSKAALDDLLLADEINRGLED